MADSMEIYEVSRILEKRMEAGTMQFLVKWKHYPMRYNTWEPLENLECDELVEKFEGSRTQKFIGVRRLFGRLVYLVKLHNVQKPELMNSDYARKYLPLFIIYLLESKITFVTDAHENHPVFAEVDEPNGQPIQIIYGTKMTGTLKYFVQFECGEHKFVNASAARREIPYLVIDYLESKIRFD